MCERQRVGVGRRIRRTTFGNTRIICALIASLALIYLIAPASAATLACSYGSCAPSSTVIGAQIMKQSAAVTTDLLNERLDDAFTQFDQAPAGVGVGTGSGAGSAGAPMGYAPSHPLLDPLDPLTKPLGPAPPTAQPSGALVLNSLGNAIASKMQADNEIRVWGGFATRLMNYGYANADFRGVLAHGAVGVDIRPSPRLLLGFMASYEHGSFVSSFNHGSLDDDGFTVASYAAYAFNPNTLLAAQFGTTRLNYHQQQSGISGQFAAYRLFGSMELRRVQQWENWTLRAALGYRHTVEFQNGFLQSDGTQVLAAHPYEGQFHVRGEATYRIPIPWGSISPTAQVELQYIPFQNLTPIINSLGARANKELFEIDFGAGFDATLAKNLSLSVRAGQAVDFNGSRRQDVTGRLRIDF